MIWPVMEATPTPLTPSQPTLDLPFDDVPGITFINHRVVMREDPLTGLRSILVAGVVWMIFAKTDSFAFRTACAGLVCSGLADQMEIVRALGVARRTLYRWIDAYTAKGAQALVPYQPSGRKSIVPASVVQAVVKLHGRGFGMRRIADRLNLSLGIVRGIYTRQGLRPVREAAQGGLDLENPQVQEDVPTVVEEAQEPVKEVQERVEALASEEGTLEEESAQGLWTPEPQSGSGVARAGVLLALPMLKKLKVFATLRRVFRGALGAFPRYGLDVVIIVLVFMALWRIKRPEGLKRFSPEELGRVLGLDRLPEMKTIRRKMSQLAALKGGAMEAMRALAEVRLQEDEDLLGVLYVDGHVRRYSGKHALAPGYSTQLRRPVSATTDIWVHDRLGDPVFLVTSQINEHLTQVLEGVLKEAREIAGAERKMTVVFDRGGWCVQLFARLRYAGYDLITYRKGRCEDLPRESFTAADVEMYGKSTTMYLHDESGVDLGGKPDKEPKDELWPVVVREIVKLNPKTGKQTRVVTSREDLSAGQVLEMLFARWRQENFFKYMREEYAIDTLVELGAEAVSPELDRPNPEVKAVTAQIKSLQQQIAVLQSERCEMIGESEPKPSPGPGWEKFVPGKARSKEIVAHVRDLRAKIEELDAYRAELPKRVSAEGYERLKVGRKHVADLFKVIAYQAETELLRLLAPHYARHEDEGRALLSAVFASSADYEVTATELRVTLAAQSSPHRTRAVAALCETLNRIPTKLPGTNLRLRFEAPDPA